jgi:hypothetical protein
MTYKVGTSSREVYKNLLQLKDELPDLFEEMKNHLSKEPYEGISGKYFIMQQHHANDYSIIIPLN